MTKKKLTEDDFDRMAEDLENENFTETRVLPREEWPLTAERGRGRPSLHGGGGKSPQLSFRVDPEMLARAHEVAAREHITVAELARQALAARIDAA